MTERKRKIVALLPMKGHSERIKGKNFRVFNGKPLFRWILDTLLSVEEIDQVVINTDARQLLMARGLVETERLVIRDRNPGLCGDFVSMNRIIEAAVRTMPEQYFWSHRRFKTRPEGEGPFY